MKNFIFIVTFLALSETFATPAVGDFAKFKMTIVQNGQVRTGIYEVSLLEKYSGGFFKMKTVVKADGSGPQISEVIVAEKDLFNDAQIQAALANCTVYGGQNGTFQVGGVTLPTCVLVRPENTEVHLAQVAFGIAKQIQKVPQEDRVVTLEMESFTRGTE